MTHVASTIECRMMCASAAAYGINEDGSLTERKPYYDAVGFHDTPEVIVGGLANINACLVGTNDDGVICAFRGTIAPDIKSIQSILDWINDFKAEPVAIGGVPGKVHDGFAKSLETLWAALVPKIKARMSAGAEPLPLFVTGHSKGGGIAPIAAARLQAAAVDTQTVYTFAGPRPGDEEFASAYDASFDDIRYEYADDIVPHMPPSALFVELLSKIPLIGKYFDGMTAWDYTPVGTLRFIDWDGDIVGDSPELDVKRIAHLGLLMLTGKLQQIADDHSSDCGHGYMTYVCPKGVCK